MIRRLGLTLVLLGLVSLTGCAYYNTFYLARKYYRQGLTEEKKNTTGRLSPQAAGLYDKSLKQADKILTRYPNSKWVDDALFLIGQAHFGREEFSSARTRFEELLARFPQSEFAPRARFWVGRTHFAEAEYVKSTEAFEAVQSAGLSPEWGDEVLYFLGEVSFAREDYAAATERYRDLVTRYPGGIRVPDALTRIGDAQFARRQYVEARQSYQTAIGRALETRDRFNLRIKIGQCLEKEQKFDDALALYRETAYEVVPADKYARIMADPEALDRNALDRNALDQLPRDQGQPGQNSALGGDNPPPPDAGTQEAQKRLQEQQLQAQRGESNRLAAAEAIASNPLALQLPRILLRQGLCHSAAGDQKAAIRTFRSVVTAFPRTSEAGEAQYRIAYVQEVEFQDYEAARKSYDEVKQQGSSLFTEQAARRAAGLNRLIALAAADTAGGAGAGRSLEAEAERAFLSAELFLFQHEKPEKALEQYTLVEADFPRSSFAPRAALARAWILNQTLGDTAAVAQVYRDIVEKYPGTDPWRTAYQIVHGKPPKEEPKPPPAPPEPTMAQDASPGDSLRVGLPGSATAPVVPGRAITPEVARVVPPSSGPPNSLPPNAVLPNAVLPSLVPPFEEESGGRPEDVALRNEALRQAGLPAAAARTDSLLRVPPAVPSPAVGANATPLDPARSPAAAGPGGTTPPTAAPAGAIVPGLPHKLPSRIAARDARGLPRAWVEWQKTLDRGQAAPMVTPPPAGSAPGKAGEASSKGTRGSKGGGGKP